MKPFTLIRLLSFLALLAASGAAIAMQAYFDAFVARYPSTTTDNNASCGVCHANTAGGGVINGYGRDWAAVYRSGGTIAAAFTAIEGTDSDLDPTGSSNITEINSNTQPGWTAGAANTTYDENSLAISATNQNPPPGIGQLDPTFPPLFTNGPPPVNGLLGTPYNFAYMASGTAPITFAVTFGALPTGLNLSPAGVISGTPTALGPFSGTVTASNGTPPNATQAFTITITPTPVAPLFTSGPPPATGTVGTPYNFSYTASGTPPITFTVPPGALPPGLNLSAGGVISGSPTAAGRFAGTVTASNGTPPDATQSFSIVIAPAPPPKIPTLSDWALVVFATALGALGVVLARRRLG